MNNAKNKDTNRGLLEYLHLATWNVRDLTSKKEEVQKELLKEQVDAAIIIEKKNYQSSNYLQHSIM